MDTTRPNSIANQLVEQNRELLNKLFIVKMELISILSEKMSKEVREKLLALQKDIE